MNADGQQKYADVTYLKLSVQRALVANITGNIMAVGCSLRGKTIIIAAYVEEPATDRDRECISCAATEIIADYPESYLIEEQFYRFTEFRFDMFDFVAFLRAEAEDELPKRDQR